jgi:hypothetical protein
LAWILKAQLTIDYIKESRQLSPSGRQIPEVSHYAVTGQVVQETVAALDTDAVKLEMLYGKKQAQIYARPGRNIYG